MKIFKTLTAVTALLITFGLAGSAMAATHELLGESYFRGDRSSHLDDLVSNFSADVPGEGKGIMVITNGGDAGKKGRVSSATVTLNGKTIAYAKDFSKKVGTITFIVDLEPDNTLMVNIKSCKGCELKISVTGEIAATGGVKPSGR